jgi:hypothetical protein
MEEHNCQQWSEYMGEDGEDSVFYKFELSAKGDKVLEFVII